MIKMFAIAAILAGMITVLGFSFNIPQEAIKTRAALGKKLFSEKLLSKDFSISCASCHKAEFAFADTASFSTGIYGKLTSRNTPSVLNMKNRPYYFWDGRAVTLEEQALMPIENPNEMGLPVKEAIQRLNQSESYKRLFKKIFNQLPNEKNLGAALAAFEQTLETVDSKFDDWSNDISELTEEEERGRELFVGNKAKCFDCHSMEDFTDDRFKNIGLYNGKELSDAGRYEITKKETDKGKFKTPGLRNIAVTGPYMHDGRMYTLSQVIEHYRNGINTAQPTLDSLLKNKIAISKQEKVKS